MQINELSVVWVCPGCGHTKTDLGYKQIMFDFICPGIYGVHTGCRYRLSKYEPKTASRPHEPGEATDGSGEPDI